MTAPDTATEPDTGDEASTGTASETGEDSDARMDVGVDAATDPDTGTDAPTETSPEPGDDTTATTNTSTGTDTLASTGVLTATDGPSSSGIQTWTSTRTPTSLGTDARTGSGSQTATHTTTMTNTTTPSGTESRTSTGSQTTTHTTTVTSTTTPSSTGSQTATASQTAIRTSTLTSTPSATSTTIGTGGQTATHTTTSTITGTATGTASRTETGTQTSTSSSSAISTGSKSVTGTQTATASTPIPVSSVSLNKATDQIGVGHTDRLTASILPTSATNLSVTWSTSDASVATVSSLGVVSAIALGTALITVTTADGGKTATCAVTVVVLVTGVALNLPAATVGIGQTVPLTATVTPSDATNKSLTWSSSDVAVATVSATGASAVVSAVGSGSATITVSTQDGNKKATCLVTVAMSARWARTPTSGSSSSTFVAATVDGDGYVYAAGSIKGTSPYAFGNSVTATGASASNNVLLVKYDATGTAQWARTVSAGSGASAFTGLATDASGNLFAAGTITGRGPYDFGNSVKAGAPYIFGSSLLLVKYDASGTAKWARTVIDAPDASSYAALAADLAGNLYAAGTISGTYPYDLGDGKTVSGTSSSGTSALLVKYSGAGIAQWAQTTISGSAASAFNAVAAGGAGVLYAAGYTVGTLAFGFGNTVTATGTGSLNALLVQYDANGTAQWARTATSGGNDSDFTAVAAGGGGWVFVAGSIDGRTANDFGAGVKVAGAYDAGSSVLLLKYDLGGAAQWGRSMASATGLSRFSSLALDPADHLYMAGLLAGPDSYDFGNSIVAATATNGNEVLLAKYDSAGLCQQAQTAATVSSISGFSAVSADSAANVYAAGYINGTNPVDFGNSVAATGAYPGGYNAILVKYR